MQHHPEVVTGRCLQDCVSPSRGERFLKMREGLKIVVKIKHFDCLERKESPPDHPAHRKVGGAIICYRLQRLEVACMNSLVPCYAVDLRMPRTIRRVRRPVGPQIGEQTLRGEHSMEQFQGMDHALAGHSSKRPRKHRDLKALVGKL